MAGGAIATGRCRSANPPAITVTNEEQTTLATPFIIILTGRKHPSLPKDSAYFHAMYRQEFPCVMGRNYLIADIEGRGHYVGTVQSVYLVSPGWYGEGNDFFFIDGEKEPSLRGTGTEDYFCDGWGFREQSGPFYGTPLWEGYDTGDRGSAYRWHIPDPVAFKKSLRVEIEHQGVAGLSRRHRHRLHRARRPDVQRGLLVSSRAAQAVARLAARAEAPAVPRRVLLKGHAAVAAAKHSDDPIEVQRGRRDRRQATMVPTRQRPGLGRSLLSD